MSGAAKASESGSDQGLSWACLASLRMRAPSCRLLLRPAAQTPSKFMAATASRLLPTDHDESVMIAVPVPVTAIGTVPVTGLSRACLSSPEAAARASGWNLRARASGRPLRLGVLYTHWRCYQPPASRATRGRRTPNRPDDTPSSS